MAHQQAISQTRLQQRIGQTIEVLIDEIDEEGAIGRSPGDAPEIDGNVYLEDFDLKPGDLIKAQITDATEYDLWAERI